MKPSNKTKNLRDMAGSYSFKKHPSSTRNLSIMPFNLTSMIAVMVFLKRHRVQKMSETIFFSFSRFGVLFMSAVIACNDLSRCAFTFHDVHQRAHIALLYDAAVLSILHRVHAVHDLLDLRQLQVLHEVIIQDGLLDQIFGPGRREKQK